MTHTSDPVHTGRLLPTFNGEPNYYLLGLLLITVMPTGTITGMLGGSLMGSLAGAHWHWPGQPVKPLALAAQPESGGRTAHNSGLLLVTDYQARLKFITRPKPGTVRAARQVGSNLNLNSGLNLTTLEYSKFGHRRIRSLRCNHKFRKTPATVTWMCRSADSTGS